MHPPGSHAGCQRALTLVEIMIVVAILAILVAVAAPRFMHVGQAARISTLQYNLALIDSALEYHVEDNGILGHPTAIKPEWFRGGMLPAHPDNDYGVPSVETVEKPLYQHPEDKVLTSSSPGAYWYNVAEGVVRARVKDQGTLETTLAFYNEVNRSSETSLGNYVGGGLW
jgi:general secretion pathway protein G